MFVGVDTKGHEGDGREYTKCVYPCGCYTKESWRDGSMGAHSTVHEFKPCNGDINTPALEPVFALHFKRAMEDHDLDDEDRDDCEILIKCMKSDEFNTLLGLEVERFQFKRKLDMKAQRARAQYEEALDVAEGKPAKKPKIAAEKKKMPTMPTSR